LFINSKASQASNALEKVARRLTAANLEVEPCTAKDPADYAKCLAKLGPGADLVVLGGGDGTLRAAADALMKTNLPLGIIPLGTANNVARSLSIPLTIDAACDVIANGRTVSMDLARVNDRIFVSVVGIGFSSQVHELVSDESKKRWRSLAYMFQAFRMLLKGGYTRFWVNVTINGERHRVRALQVTVCNGRYYGAHVGVHPEATLSDGMLDLSIIEAKSFLKGFFRAVLPWLPPPGAKGLRLFRAAELQIETSPRMRLDVEGMTDLTTPATFAILPGALKVRVPQA